MRIPISWLREFVEIDLPVAELAELITNAGLEVTAIEPWGTAGAPLEWDCDKVLVAHLVQVDQHPEADRLVIATVDCGEAAPKKVITGAPNLMPYLGKGDVSELGLLSPIVLEGGTYLDSYKDGKPTKLKAKKLRGILNNAMLCSTAELGLGENHDGILLAPGSTWCANGIAPKPGTPLVEVLGDSVLEIDIIPNIARCASILGVAREVAALTERPLTLPSFSVQADGPSFEDQLSIETSQPELNPRFVAMLIEGVEQKPAPLWMQHRLQLCGQRPINVVVDISNYVMMEIGQPNHTFDWDFLRQRAGQPASDTGSGRGTKPVKIITRLAEPGEILTTLDGVEHKVPDSTILVTDASGNLSLGGIMGGANSEIQSATTNVLLEAAAWNFINIRRSARLLGVNTEASFRFSRGVHPSQALLGAQRAAELLRIHAGGTVAKGIVDYYPQPKATLTLELSTTYVNRRSGLQLTNIQVADCLKRLEFTVDVRGEDLLIVTAPDHRLDIEGPHDLLEEVCRMVGYANIPESLLGDALPPQRGNLALEVEESAKDLLAAAGFQEVITYRLTTPEAEARSKAGEESDPIPYVTLTNPSTQNRRVMRHSLLASVLEVAEANLLHTNDLALFEMGHVYLQDGKSTYGEDLPSEYARLAMVLTGRNQPAAWDRSHSEATDFFDFKGVLESLLASLHIVDVEYGAREHPTFRPGRTARLTVQGEDAGVFGELHPLVIEQQDLRTQNPVLAAELNLEVLVKAATPHFTVEPIPLYPAVREDLALLVDGTLPEAAVRATLLEAGAPLLRSVELFDVYSDEKLDGKKSLAYHLTVQAPNRTLKDKDVAKLRRRILATVEKRIGAVLRS